MEAAVVVLVGVSVLLQLHASDTLTGGFETAAAAAGRPQTSSSVSSPQQPHESSKNPAGNHQLRYEISPQDEDLLDLMVRIAETPQEWERIHRVLSLIGREKDSFETTKNSLQTESQMNDVKNATDNDLGPSNQNASDYNSANVSSTEADILKTSATLPSLTVTPDMATYTDSEAVQPLTEDDTDSRWPDFEEAIVKKVKKPYPIDENDILESNWLEDDWLDPNWNEYLSENNKQQTTLVSDKVFLENVTPPVTTKQKMEKIDDVPRSRLASDPKILEFRLKDVVALRNQTAEHSSPETEESNTSSSRGGHPMFVYHRVTTSPQQRRGNSAFIAVSVVRQDPVDTPTTQSPHSLWGHLRRIQKSMKDSLSKHQRKHPHWREKIHWKRNRGRRHHHIHSATQH